MNPVHVAAERNIKNVVVYKAVFSFGSKRSYGRPASLDAPQSLRKVAPLPLSPSARRSDKRYPTQRRMNVALRHGRLSTQALRPSYCSKDSVNRLGIAEGLIAGEL